MFLGLKPQHQGAAMGYVEKNLLADVTLWQHCLRAEVGLLSDRHRRVNRREIQKRRDVGLTTMTGRRRLQMAEIEYATRNRLFFCVGIALTAGRCNQAEAPGEARARAVARGL